MFDFSAFENLNDEIAKKSEAKKTAEKVSSKNQKKAELLDSFSPELRLAFERAKFGLVSTTKLQKKITAAEKIPQLNIPHRLRATAGRHGDDFSTEKNKRFHTFILGIIATAAANKGWISLVDVCDFWTALGLPDYLDGTSPYFILQSINGRLNRTVELKDEKIIIHEIELDPILAPYPKIVNQAIASVRSKK